MSSFSLQIVQNYEQFKIFFSAEAELEKISHFMAEKDFQRPEYFLNSWQIFWITVKSPFENLFSFLFEQIAKIFECLGLVSISRTCSILSETILLDQKALQTQRIYGNHFLMLASNQHQLSSCDFYTNSPLSISELQDEKIKAMSFYATYDQANYFQKQGICKGVNDLYQLKFYHQQGICRGMVLWFIYLYLKAQQAIKDSDYDPYQLFLAVTKEFQNGASRQAALLHTFDSTEETLGLKHTIELHFSEKTIGKKKDLVLSRIEQLKPGVYGIGLDKHRIAYIKIDDSLGFIWNPNQGGHFISGKQEKEVFKACLTKDSTHLYFEKYELFLDQDQQIKTAH